MECCCHVWAGAPSYLGMSGKQEKQLSVGERREIWLGGIFLSSGGNLIRNDFDHSNLFKAKYIVL